MNFVIKGTICHSVSADKLEITRGYAVCEGGISRGVFDVLPEPYTSFPLYDFGEALILPGMADLHIHAAQFAYRGTGADAELLEWLGYYAFPEEGRFADPAYADKAYTIFTEAMRNGATTRAAIFASRHAKATEILMEKLEAAGLVSYVGKVNMDREAPDPLREPDPVTAGDDTENWVKATVDRFANTYPILTPRFIPSCTDALMKRLGEIQRTYHVAVQSHLSENISEIEWVKALRPDARFYGDAYDIDGLFGKNPVTGEAFPTLMSHCVWSGEEEIALMKAQGVYVVHCPASNLNVASGIAPIRRYMDAGLHIGLGSDVAGGQSESMFRAVTDAIQLSKMYWRHIDQACRPLTFEEGFYLGTLGGGSFFGKAGCFAEGYEFDAVILDDSSLATTMDPTDRQRLERAFYLGLDRFGVIAKFVRGRRIL